MSTVAHCTQDLQFGVIACVVSVNTLAYSGITCDTQILLWSSCSFVIKHSSDIVHVILSSILQMGEKELSYYAIQGHDDGGMMRESSTPL